MAQQPVTAGSVLTWQRKVRPPRLTGEFVDRPHLVATVETALDQHVVVLAAGSGCGKTTLAAQWAAATDREVAWLTLDSGDDDLVSLAISMISAVQVVRPGWADEVLLMAMSAGDTFVRTGLATLLGSMQNLSSPFVLVLDDVDRLADPQCLQVIDRVLDYLPSSISLLITTSDAGVPDLVRLRLHNRSTVLGAADLAFTQAECIELVEMSGHDGARLGRRLHRATTGWPAGVRLAIPPAGRGEPAFDVRGSGIRRFLADMLHDRLPPDQAEFLLSIAHVDAVCPDLGTALTGLPDAGRRLADLERRHVLEAPTSLDGPWWSVRPVISSFARDHVAGTDPERGPRLYAAAARWHADRGAIEPALDYAARLADDDRLAIKILLRLHLRAAMSGRNAMIAQKAAALAAHHPDVAELRLVQGWANSVGGRFARTEASLALAESTDLPEPRGSLVLAEVAAIRSHVKRQHGQYRQALDLLRAADAHLARTDGPDEWMYTSVVGARMEMHRASLLLLTGELAAAHTLCTDVAARVGSALARASAHCILALIDWTEGDIDPRLQMEIVLALVDTMDAAPTLPRAIFSLMQAVTDPGQDGVRGLHDIEVLGLLSPGPAIGVMALCGRAVRVSRGWPSAAAADQVPTATGDPDDQPAASAANLLSRARGTVAGMDDPGGLSRLIARAALLAGVGATDASFGAELTDQERRILRLLSGTLTERQIGERLHLSHNTVRTYRRRLYRKLGVSSRDEAVRVGKGLSSPG